MLIDLSRRTFIRTATGLIFAHWGGLRILAGPPSALAQASPGAQPAPHEFIYGTEILPSPNPPRALRHEMLQAIANEYKFNIIRIYCSWVYLNPEPGKFDFTEIEEVLTDCDRLGLKVLMGAVIEEAPYWLEAAHPESQVCRRTGSTAASTDCLYQYEWRMAEPMHGLACSSRCSGDISSRTGHDRFQAPVDVRLRRLERTSS